MLKRTFDIIVSLISLLILCPVLLALAVMIKATVSGPVFFVQRRVGKHGKLFGIVKFRTMRLNNGGSCITGKDDDRITPFGRVVRKHKWDELPSLWNVFKGEMSFVGPRPDVPGYADKLTGGDRQILEIRPGLTGPASLKYSREEELLADQDDPVKFNDEVIFPDKVRINLAYISAWSIWLDFKIIAYTILGLKLKEPWAQ